METNGKHDSQIQETGGPQTSWRRHEEERPERRRQARQRRVNQ
jgi:hypothetical protein